MTFGRSPWSADSAAFQGKEEDDEMIGRKNWEKRGRELWENMALGPRTKAFCHIYSLDFDNWTYTTSTIKHVNTAPRSLNKGKVTLVIIKDVTLWMFYGWIQMYRSSGNVLSTGKLLLDLTCESTYELPNYPSTSLGYHLHVFCLGNADESFLNLLLGVMVTILLAFHGGSLRRRVWSIESFVCPPFNAPAHWEFIHFD